MNKLFMNKAAGCVFQTQEAKEFFDEKFPELDEHDEIVEYFYDLVSVYEEVFFEIGSIIGAKIGMQLQKRIQELQ